jgi:hypothetical protein
MNTTALVNTVANITLLATGAPSIRANIQSKPKSVLQPKGDRLLTTEDLLLQNFHLKPELRIGHQGYHTILSLPPVLQMQAAICFSPNWF